jgi:hypothetical protein
MTSHRRKQAVPAGRIASFTSFELFRTIEKKIVNRKKKQTER